MSYFIPFSLEGPMLPRKTPGLKRAAALLLLLIATPAAAAELKPQTVAAFDRYATLTEQRIDAAATPLWIDGLPPAERQRALGEVRAGDTWITSLETRDAGRDIPVPDGLLHHWLGTAFIPGVTTAQAVALLQDYNRHAQVYAPVVQQSRLLTGDGEHFTIFLRFYQKKGITVIVNTNHDARFTTVTPQHVKATIRTTRVAQVEDAGTPSERELPVGNDGGYLWRLNTYWRFVERDGGTYVQCESLTLTRGIPTGLGWLIRPFITSIPRESLVFTLEKTREALLAR
ncbi:MAG: hypothetical protein AB7K63_17770 [Vicinamibacterales bacterium]